MVNAKRPRNDFPLPADASHFLIMKEISPCDISGITTKAPCEAALMGERHVRIEISDFVMRTFVLQEILIKAPHIKLVIHGRHVCKGIQDSVLHTFVLLPTKSKKMRFGNV